jgi:xanthine dehydrogenase accessory factor
LEENGNGLLQLSPSGISFKADEVPANDFYYQFRNEQDWLYAEKLGFKNCLYIIGGGHCALAFSRLMSGMDFYIYLIEDRKDLNTLEQNDFVHEKLIVEDYSHLQNIVKDGEDVYVVIMSFGYRTDDLAVRALWKKEFAYLGLLGSAAKIDKMFAAYRQEGISENDLQKIYAPVGLPINSQTPEEIAVSIAAQIIEVKNRKYAAASPLPSGNIISSEGK